MKKADYLKMLFNIEEKTPKQTLEDLVKNEPLMRHCIFIAYIIDNDGNKLKIFKEESDASFRDRCIGKENNPTSYDYVQIENTLDSEYLELDLFNRLQKEYKIQYLDDYTEEKLVSEIKDFENVKRLHKQSKSEEE